MKLAEFRGAYPADRAAALSGVPRSTVHYWARNKILLPSVSETKVKLWSYTDLMGLRTIHWLRRRKVTDEGWEVPASTMPAVRLALSVLRDLDLELWSAQGGPAVYIDPGGRIYVVPPTGPESVETGERPLDPDVFNLIAPFKTRTSRGPDLNAPRPHLRILPGKLSGEPHIAQTRIETTAIAALAERGFDSKELERLYPQAQPVALVEAVDLERQLGNNLALTRRRGSCRSSLPSTRIFRSRSLMH
jgi:uncharacterized protein (DUF433 family)